MMRGGLRSRASPPLFPSGGSEVPVERKTQVLVAEALVHELSKSTRELVLSLDAIAREVRELAAEVASLRNGTSS